MTWTGAWAWDPSSMPIPDERGCAFELEARHDGGPPTRAAYVTPAPGPTPSPENPRGLPYVRVDTDGPVELRVRWVCFRDANGGPLGSETSAVVVDRASPWSPWSTPEDRPDGWASTVPEPSAAAALLVLLAALARRRSRR